MRLSVNILFLGKKIFEIPAIFSNWAKTSRMLITFFRPEMLTQPRSQATSFPWFSPIRLPEQQTMGGRVVENPGNEVGSHLINSKQAY